MTVYVVQNQHQWDPRQRAFVPKFDYSQSAEFGDLVFLLSPEADIYRPDSLVSDLREGLGRYRSDEDYLILTGNPIMTGLAVTIAAQNDGAVSILQWSGRMNRYTPIHAKKLFTSRKV